MLSVVLPILTPLLNRKILFCVLAVFIKKGEKNFFKASVEKSPKTRAQTFLWLQSILQVVN
jgi:hypothetical protein